MIFRIFLLVGLVAPAVIHAEERGGKRAVEKDAIDRAVERNKEVEKFAIELRKAIDGKEPLRPEQLEALEAVKKEMANDKDPLKTQGEFETMAGKLRGDRDSRLTPQTRDRYQTAAKPIIFPTSGNAAIRSQSGGGNTSSYAVKGGGVGSGSQRGEFVSARTGVKHTPMSAAEIKPRREQAQKRLTTVEGRNYGGANPESVAKSASEVFKALDVADREDRDVKKIFGKDASVQEQIIQTQLRLARMRRGLETRDPGMVDSVDKMLGIGADPKNPIPAGTETSLRGMHYLSELMDGQATRAILGDKAGIGARKKVVDAKVEALRKEAKAAEARKEFGVAESLRARADNVELESKALTKALEALNANGMPADMLKLLDPADAKELKEEQAEIDKLNDLLRDENMPLETRLEMEQELANRILKRTSILEAIKHKAEPGSELDKALRNLENSYGEALFDLVVERLAKIELLEEIRQQLFKAGFKGDIDAEARRRFDAEWKKREKEMLEKVKPTVCRDCMPGFPASMKTKGCPVNPANPVQKPGQHFKGLPKP